MNIILLQCESELYPSIKFWGYGSTANDERNQKPVWFTEFSNNLLWGKFKVISWLNLRPSAKFCFFHTIDHSFLGRRCLQNTNKRKHYEFSRSHETVQINQTRMFNDGQWPTNNTTAHTIANWRQWRTIIGRTSDTSNWNIQAMAAAHTGRMIDNNCVKFHSFVFLIKKKKFDLEIRICAVFLLYV